MNSHNGHRRPDEIEASIQRTRTDLDETLTELEQSLTPGQLIDQAMDYLRNSSAREYLTNLAAASKRDPVPLALVGVGLAWLMMSGRRHADGDRSAESAHGMDGAARSAGQRAGEMADSARHRVHEFADSARQKTHELGESARQTAGHLRHSAREQGERLRSGYEHIVNEQPLVLGAVGLAIGAVFAAIAPRTPQEDALLGRDGSRRVDRGTGDVGPGVDDSQHSASSRPPAATPDGSAGSMRATAASTPGAVVPDDAEGLSRAAGSSSAMSGGTSFSGDLRSDNGRSPAASAPSMSDAAAPASRRDGMPPPRAQADR